MQRYHRGMELCCFVRTAPLCYRWDGSGRQRRCGLESLGKNGDGLLDAVIGVHFGYSVQIWRNGLLTAEPIAFGCIRE